MVSKNSLKYIKSLQLKKYRLEEQSFCVEGMKSVLEVLQSNYRVKIIAGTQIFFDQYSSFIKNNEEKLVLSTKSLSGISNFKNNDSVLAVVEIPSNLAFKIEDEWVLGLDGINDPGNLGTILRLADWYGIRKVICSTDCVDVYNPKTIASSMGSFVRIQLFYTDIKEFLQDQQITVIGTFLNGENIHNVKFAKRGLILMGSESHGIRKELEPIINRNITIPSFGKAESLNVAMATAIILDNLHRSMVQ
jgi:RNA methyltransferase, TrmH family